MSLPHDFVSSRTNAMIFIVLFFTSLQRASHSTNQKWMKERGNTQIEENSILTSSLSELLPETRNCGILNKNKLKTKANDSAELFFLFYPQWLKWLCNTREGKTVLCKGRGDGNLGGMPQITQNRLRALLQPYIHAKNQHGIITYYKIFPSVLWF